MDVDAWRVSEPAPDKPGAGGTWMLLSASNTVFGNMTFTDTQTTWPCGMPENEVPRSWGVGTESADTEAPTQLTEQVRFTYRNGPQVEDFLSRYPHVANYLGDVTPAIARYFGPSAEVVLEAVTHAHPGSYEEMVAWILSTGPIEEGLEKVDLLEEELSESRQATVGNIFSFNIEFG